MNTPPTNERPIYQVLHEYPSGTISNQRVVFSDQAQANAACIKIGHASNAVVRCTFKTHFGETVIDIGRGFIGNRPMNSNAPVEYDDGASL